MSEFIKLNSFVKGKDGVYCETKQAEREFGYSDGQEVEQRLRRIFNSVEDLSSTSYELQNYITDWPSEYHLTPIRANLLRVLNLSGVKRVLELGCGCGSITRYLGEQSGVQVDSVEGSPIRAGLAALRCRDLDNVNISTANFNDVEFPEDYYDLVLFVGVTEYAGRFSSAETDEEALQDLLALAKRTAKKDGAVLVAIENRTGMKYVVGANEDHYAKPYIGIHNYSEPAGIRTYTKKEWEANIDTAGFKQHEFIYPFPDYKIPTIFLSEEYVQSNPYAYVHLEGNRSRDYVQDFEEGSREVLLWESAVTSGTLGDYANSFLILMANSKKAITHLSKYDFAHLPTFNRKLEYSLKIAKPKNKQYVERSYVEPAKQPKKQQGIEHVLVNNEPFYSGPVLSVEWARSLISYPDLQLFEQYLKDYFAYLQSVEKLTIDLLPSNLIKLQDSYQVIDEEWKLEQALTPELVFYRAVLLFYCNYPDFIEQKLSKARGLKTIGDWLYFAFNIIGQPIKAETLQDYFQQNEAFQQAISYRHGEVNFATSLTETEPLLILHWRNAENNYQQNDHIGARGSAETGRQTVEISLPINVRKVSDLMLQPCFDFHKEKSGFFRFYKAEIVAINSEQKQRSLWVCDGQQAIVETSQLGDVTFENGVSGDGFYVTGDTPRIELCSKQEFALNDDEQFLIKFELLYPRSEQYLAAKERYLSVAHQYETQLDQLLAAKSELELIKSSRGWKLLGQMRRALSFAKKPVNFFTRKVSAIKQIGLSAYLADSKKKVDTKLGKVSLADDQYQNWFAQLPADYWIEVNQNGDQPKAHIIVAIDSIASTKTLESVAAQTYPNCQISLVCNEQFKTELEQVLANIKFDYQLEYLADDANYAKMFNHVASKESSDYLLCLRNGDYLLSQAVNELVHQVNIQNADLVYADEVLLDKNALVVEPYFKPHYSPHLFDSHNYCGAAFMLSHSLWQQLQGFDQLSTNPFYDLVLRTDELEKTITHLSKPVFYIARQYSAEDNKPVLESALRRRSEAGKVIAQPNNFLRLNRSIQGQPLVSIVIPFKDAPDLLQGCIQSILQKTDYTNFEIVGISNDSISAGTYKLMNEFAEQDKRIQFHQYNSEFNFAKLVNYGASLAKGEHLVLMNNDIEIIDSQWLAAMLEYSQLDNVGAVGAKLLYPNNSIQHAGIILGLDGYASHAYRHFAGDADGYFNRLNGPCNVSALTGALLMVKKSLYQELSGFDEQQFAIAFNDIDFCLRLRKQGYLNVFTPYASAWHHESVSRGYELSQEQLQRFEVEKANFLSRHQAFIDETDQYYNDNFNQKRDDFNWVLR